ncbi:MAG: flagellar export chaperone FliS [Candidatus Dadabacteria bacterium]|nr:MAG: flagellar export chaperone FliS [Candidatus Dadabacteria bacterium]
MYKKNAHELYKNVQITTTDKGRLLLMMYEGAIKFLRQAKSGLESNDIPKFCRFLSKAQAIIAELMNTLDFEKGGKIARDLDRLYDFMLFYLTEANLQRDAEKVQKVIELIDTIYSAYKEIIENQKESTKAVEEDKEDSSSEEKPSGRIEISL